MSRNVPSMSKTSHVCLKTSHTSQNVTSKSQNVNQSPKTSFHLIKARRWRHSQEWRRQPLVVVPDPLDEGWRAQRLRDDALQLDRACRLHEDVPVAEDADPWYWKITSFTFLNDNMLRGGRVSLEIKITASEQYFVAQNIILPPGSTFRTEIRLLYAWNSSLSIEQGYENPFQFK